MARLYFGQHPVPPTQDEIENAFDDRTLATFIGKNVAHPDNDAQDILRTLERWGDRSVRS